MPAIFTALDCSENLSLPNDSTTELIASGSEKFEHQNICFAFICDHRNCAWIYEKLVVFCAIY